VSIIFISQTVHRIKCFVVEYFVPKIIKACAPEASVLKLRVMSLFSLGLWPAPPQCLNAHFANADGRLYYSLQDLQLYHSVSGFYWHFLCFLVVTTSSGLGPLCHCCISAAPQVSSPTSVLQGSFRSATSVGSDTPWPASGSQIGPSLRRLLLLRPLRYERPDNSLCLFFFWIRLQIRDLHSF
jgi:hypothetical protein